MFDVELFYWMIGEEIIDMMVKKIDFYLYVLNKVEKKLKWRLTRRAGSFVALRGAVTLWFWWFFFDWWNIVCWIEVIDLLYNIYVMVLIDVVFEICVCLSKDVVFVKEIGGGMFGVVFVVKMLSIFIMCCVKVMYKWKVVYLD